MENLDGTIVTTSASAIAASLGVSVGSVSLVVTSYLTTLAVVVPASGWVSRRFGARRVFLFAVALFTAASAACAASPALGWLIVSRMLQGVGGALMTPVGRTVVLERALPSEIIRLIAYLTWPGLLAPIIAPLIGAIITTSLSWHWIFLINLPLGATAFVVGLKLVPRHSVDRGRVSLDGGGLVLLGGGLGLLVYGAHLLSADDIAVVPLMACLGSSVVLLMAAVRHLLRVEEPLLDLRVLRLPAFGSSQAALVMFSVTVDAVPFMLPLVLQQVRGWSAVEAGVGVLAVFAGNVAAKPATTWMLNRWGFRAVLAWSSMGLALSTAALGWTCQASALSVVCVAAVIHGGFRSVGFTAMNTVALSDVGPGQLADANTMAAAIRQLGAALGVALGAVALSLGAFATGGEGGPDESHAFLVFAVVGVPALLSLAVTLVRLPEDAGENLRS